MSHMFKVGDRVQWKQREPVACVAPPCDRTPGTITKIVSAPPGELRGGFLVGDSGIIVSVQHDGSSDFPPTDWPAESLEFVDRSPGPIGLSEERKSEDKLSDGTVIAGCVGAVATLGGLAMWLDHRTAKREQAELEEYREELAFMNQEKLLRELNEWQFQNRGIQDNTNTLVLIGYMMFFSTMFASRR